MFGMNPQALLQLHHQEHRALMEQAREPRLTVPTIPTLAWLRPAPAPASREVVCC